MIKIDKIQSNINKVNNLESNINCLDISKITNISNKKNIKGKKKKKKFKNLMNDLLKPISDNETRLEDNIKFIKKNCGGGIFDKLPDRI